MTSQIPQTSYSVRLSDDNHYWQLTRGEFEKMQDAQLPQHPTLGVNINHLIENGSFYRDSRKGISCLLSPENQGFLFD